MTDSDSYADSYRRHMDAFRVDLWRQLDSLPSLPADVGTEVLRYLLGLACQATHMGAIMLGRRSLVRIPKPWVLQHLPEAAAVLDLNDDWEFRRYIEACAFIDPEFAEAVAKSGVTSDNPHLREAAQDMTDGCAKFARRYAEDVEEPPC